MCEVKVYEYVYCAIKLQVVYLNAPAAGRVSALGPIYIRTNSNPRRSETLNFIKPLVMPFRPKTALHNEPPAAL